MLGRRVVITGLGVLSPVGNSVEDAWSNIRQGNSGIGPITEWEEADWPVRFGGAVKNFDPLELLGRRDARRTDRITQLAWVATKQAIEQSELVITDDNRDDIGVLIGTGLGGLKTILNGVAAFRIRGQKAVSPFLVPMLLPDSPSGKISMEWGLCGPNFSVNSACATGNNSIGEAAAMIARGSADVMVTGSTEAGLIDLAMIGFNNMTAISRRNDNPLGASRPFDMDRDGFVVAEGAAVLILESLEFAEARGANILGEILGYGATSDAFHVTAPHPEGRGAIRAMRLALKDAGLEPEDVDYVNAHGTSTPLNDALETLAIKQVFGEYAYQLPVSSTKSMTGHIMGAAASVEAIFCIKALEENFIPPTINLDNPDPVCDLDYVPHKGREKELNVIMSNAFGFGGHNAVLVFGKYH
jgi:3-oxoacyl-[acyl-carrier-protein] synthase II